MPIEGISMTTVFSLLTVGMVLSMSVFLGGYFLQPSFDVQAIVGGVAYDLATMYDIAYSMPGEVTLHYYGPNICEWNYAQESSIDSFHCFSGAVMKINDVRVQKNTLLVYNDTYLTYDYETDRSELPPDAIPTQFVAFGSVDIPFFNAQLCPANAFASCDYAYAPFASSYTDRAFAYTQTPYTYAVEDYSFVVKKTNVNNYYYTIVQDEQNPWSLSDLIEKLANVYNLACNGELTEGDMFGLKMDNSKTAPLKLSSGTRWQVYDNSIICQERFFLSNYTDEYNDYLIVEEDEDLYMKLNSYIIDYCFDISTITARNPCDNVDILITDDFISNINNADYFVGSTSCIEPFFVFNNGTIELKARDGVTFNEFSGACSNTGENI